MPAKGTKLSDTKNTKVTFTVDLASSGEEQDASIIELINSLPVKRKQTIMKETGVGSEIFTCYLCGEVLNKSDFFVSSDTRSCTNISRVCKKCAAELAMPSIRGIQQEPTKDSVLYAMSYIDKPFLEDAWDKTIKEVSKKQSAFVKTNVYSTYNRIIASSTYTNKLYKDSDIFNDTKNLTAVAAVVSSGLDKETIENFEKNKSDVVRLLGYAPFEKEAIIDQPFLYSQLVGYLDMSGDSNDDMMRISSVITIVRGFLQQSKYDDMISMLQRTEAETLKNISNIKALNDMKSNVTATIQKLAQESCISLKNSKNASKGEDSWTGKVKKLKELKLREAEVNSFDIGTCFGMRQVADISHASILKQIRLDENDYSEMLAKQRDLIERYRRECELAIEQSRILLRENLDLKDYLVDLGVDFNNCLSEDPVLNMTIDELIVDMNVGLTIDGKVIESKEGNS